MSAGHRHVSIEMRKNDQGSVTAPPEEQQDELENSNTDDPDDERASGRAAVVLLVLAPVGLAAWAAISWALAHLLSG